MAWRIGEGFSQVNFTDQDPGAVSGKFTWNFSVWPHQKCRETTLPPTGITSANPNIIIGCVSPDRSGNKFTQLFSMRSVPVSWKISVIPGLEYQVRFQPFVFPVKLRVSPFMADQQATFNPTDIEYNRPIPRCIMQMFHFHSSSCQQSFIVPVLYFSSIIDQV